MPNLSRKTWIYMFHHQLYENSRADGDFSLAKALSLGERKLLIQTSYTPCRNCLCSQLSSWQSTLINNTLLTNSVAARSDSSMRADSTKTIFLDMKPGKKSLKENGSKKHYCDKSQGTVTLAHLLSCGRLCKKMMYISRLSVKEKKKAGGYEQFKMLYPA